jgi:hypothetical protein
MQQDLNLERRVVMPLPDNISRCHDSGCNEKEECVRWIERTAKGDSVVHSVSLFPYDIPLGDKCPLKWEPINDN